MAEENGKETGGKYGKLREGATRAERKEATFDDMRNAAAEVRKAAEELRAAADADRERCASIARDAASLAESARIIAGGSGDPAALYREQMREGARLAASDADFRGVLEAAARELARSTAEAVEAVDGACLKVGSEWSRGVAQMRVAVLGRVFAAFGVVMAVCCIALTATCFLKLAPAKRSESEGAARAGMRACKRACGLPAGSMPAGKPRGGGFRMGR